MAADMASDGAERKGISLFWLILAMVVGVLVLGDLNARMADARRLTRDSQQLQTEVAALETEGIVLRTQVEGAATDPTVEAWARQEGKLVQPGDVLVVPIPGGDVTPTPQPQSVQFQSPPSNWEVWWALIFGD
jgi:cell division protein FtsB